MTEPSSSFALSTGHLQNFKLCRLFPGCKAALTVAIMGRGYTLQTLCSVVLSLPINTY